MPCKLHGLPLKFGAVLLAALLGGLLAERNAAASFFDSSPGKLAKAHAYIDGSSNCAKCHVTGKRDVDAKKCLDCHDTVQKRINDKRGVHGSAKALNRPCELCHKEHKGTDADMFGWQTFGGQAKFNHEISGFSLSGRHSVVDCKDCHKQAEAAVLAKGAKRFLGLAQKCESCHEDVHKGKLPDCASCHGQEHPFKEVAKFVDSAGKEAPVRRTRMRLLIGFAADFYRQLMNGLVGGPMAGDPPLRKAVQAALKNWPGSEETAADCLETCLTMEGHVDVNANLNTLAECWLDELAEKARVGRWVAS